jgi:hypothetical protein
MRRLGGMCQTDQPSSSGAAVGRCRLWVNRYRNMMSALRPFIPHSVLRLLLAAGLGGIGVRLTRAESAQNTRTQDRPPVRAVAIGCWRSLPPSSAVVANFPNRKSAAARSKLGPDSAHRSATPRTREEALLLAVRVSRDDLPDLVYFWAQPMKSLITTACLASILGSRSRLCLLSGYS